MTNSNIAILKIKKFLFNGNSLSLTRIISAIVKAIIEVEKAIANIPYHATILNDGM